MKNYNIEKFKTILGEQLINKRKAALLLSRHFECDQNKLFYLYQKGFLPETGKITDKVHFFFHGLGCSVNNKEENWKIDLEFGPLGNVLAFDKNTICHLLNQKIDLCDNFINDLVDKKFIKLVDEELYRFINTYPKYNTWSSTEEEIDASVADRYMIII